MYPTLSINVIEYIQINPLHDYDEEYKNKLWYSGCFIWFFFIINLWRKVQNVNFQ